MDYTYQHPLQMPSCYALLTEEEMTYTDGGFTFTVGRYEVTVNTDALMQSAVSILLTASVNLMVLFGQASFNQISNEIQTGLADGLGLNGTAAHVWGRLNTTSRVLTVGMVGLSGYYIFLQARSMYYSLKNIYDAIVNTANQGQDSQAAAAQPALAA